jgi:hypothetical protein
VSQGPKLDTKYSSMGRISAHPAGVASTLIACRSFGVYGVLRLGLIGFTPPGELILVIPCWTDAYVHLSFLEIGFDSV